nr:MAG TPA: hypothetical protein [Herelleviridae sp.]
MRIGFEFENYKRRKIRLQLLSSRGDCWSWVFPPRRRAWCGQCVVVIIT